MRIFVAGIMQGSHLGATIHNQDYRTRIKQLFPSYFPGADVYDPLADHNAIKQLTLMRGRTVFFHSALCLFNAASGNMQAEDVIYEVRFRQLTDAQIENYLRLEQPYHCAGSAKSEGLGIALMEYMRGDDPNALIGLPLISLISMLQKEGVSVI